VFTYGAGFVRLAGYAADGEPVTITPDAGQVVDLARRGATLVGHNILGFDLLALSRDHGLAPLDIVQLAQEGRLKDTLILARLADPPPAGLSGDARDRSYGLDALGPRLGEGTKSGSLKALVKDFGGYDQIPLDNPEYRDYLTQDVVLGQRVAQHYPTTPYSDREHRIAAIAAQVSLNGFRVDLDLLPQRIEQEEARRATHLAELSAQYPLPTTTKDGKRPARDPLGTGAGKEVMAQAFRDLGVEPPLTEKGNLSLSKEHLEPFLEEYRENPAIVGLTTAVLEVNGARAVYQMIKDNLVGDRVHPSISMNQVSGRWSKTNPALAILGKSDGRHVERDPFLPDEGEVLLSADLSQIDQRAVAVHSQDPNYIAMFAPGQDFHTEVALRVFKDTSRRSDAKRVGHSWNYGQSIHGLMQIAGVSLRVAYQFDEEMRAQFPRLVEWRDEVREEARAGFLLDNGFGRKMRPNAWQAHTQGPALMGQGCARDLMMEGLLRLPKELLPMLRGVIHDEVILSVPIKQVRDVEQELLAALNFLWAPPGAKYQVPIVAALVGRGPNWGSIYSKG
jgi:DNA polymerase I